MDPNNRCDRTKDVEEELCKNLQKEVAPLVFTQKMKDRVLRKARPASFWNKEFRVPLIPAAALFSFMLAVGFGWLLYQPDKPGDAAWEERQLVILDSGIFYKDQMEDKGDGL